MKEMRTLSFSEREVMQAVLDLMRRQRQPLPSGQLLGMELEDDPVAATLLVEDDYGARTTIRRTAAELAASLVNYCIDRRIRLPASGRKFVQVIGGSVNLVIYMDEPAAKPRPARRAPSVLG